MRLLQRITALLCALALWCTGACAAEGIEDTQHTPFVYGQSEMGRDLVCHRLGSTDAAASILIVFGVHGFEDAYDHDGEVLRLIAERMISHYAQNPAQMQGFCLYIIPSANPDGLIDGNSKDGYGRCNANGLDVNRDFPFDWEENTTSRNLTGEAPLSTAEARAICDLVADIQPTFGIDVHGWKKAAYGNGKMAEVFAKPFRFKVQRLSTEGMLAAWLNSVTNEGILMELPPDPNSGDYVTSSSAALIEGLNAWMQLCASRR